MNVLPACMFVDPELTLDSKGQKKMSDPPELESLMVVSCHMNQAWFLYKSQGSHNS